LNSHFASTARADRNQFRWIQGQEHLRGFESTPGKLRHFCSNCGSHLVAEWRDQDQVIVRIATLDDDPGSMALAHIWLSHDVPWLSDSNEIGMYQEGK
jgi:ADP-ribosyl-[dinitrogen reductase] hydrolase